MSRQVAATGFRPAVESFTSDSRLRLRLSNNEPAVADEAGERRAASGERNVPG